MPTTNQNTSNMYKSRNSLRCKKENNLQTNSSLFTFGNGQHFPRVVMLFIKKTTTLPVVYSMYNYVQFIILGNCKKQLCYWLMYWLCFIVILECILPTYEKKFAYNSMPCYTCSSITRLVLIGCLDCAISVVLDLLSCRFVHHRPQVYKIHYHCC